MASIWRPLDPAIYKEWVRELLEEQSEALTSWETDFLASIETQLIRWRTLTEAQATKLESIYAEKTP
jgi:hypothetical protein